MGRRRVEPDAVAQTGPVEQPLQQALVDAARHLRPRQCGQRRGQGCGCRLPKVMDVMALGRRKARRRQVSSGHLVRDGAEMHGGKPLEPYYSCIPLEDCMEDETIFAWSMNDKPLPCRPSALPCACGWSPSTGTRWS